MHDQPHTTPPSPRRPSRRPAYGRGANGRASWVRTGLILTCGFLLWLVMDATVLQHNSTVISPPGTRRTVALLFLDRLTFLSRWTGLDLPVEGANEALGRLSDGGFKPPPPPPTTTTTTLPAGATTTTTTLPEPTAAHPLRILLVGDSVGEDLDFPLLNDLTATNVVKVFTDDVIDTGLVRLDYYPWIAELEHDVYVDRPDVVIGMIGTNDFQSFVVPPIGFGTAAWKAKYLDNVGQFFAIGKGGGRQMLWVSVPIIANPGLNRELQLVRGIQHEAAVTHRVFYVDSDTTLDPGGTFHQYLKIGGQFAQVRSGDGVHLYPAGAALLANAVMVALQRDLHVRLR